MDEIVQYKQESYLIAIDDYTGSNGNSDFLNLADIIKVDGFEKSRREVTKILSTIKESKTILLAEKVHDGNAYRELQTLGFDLFQFFFARPDNLSGTTIKSSQMVKIKALSVLQNPKLEISQLVELIAFDPAMTYRLLRLFNSAAFGFSMKIESVEHAVILLGMRQVKYWLSMEIMSDVSGPEHPNELFQLALTRGKFFEELTEEGIITDYQPDALFLFGLLSLLEVMLGRPFKLIFNELPLPQELKSGYLESDSYLSKVLQLVVHMEGDDLEPLTDFCKINTIHPQTIFDASVRAQAWTELICAEVFKSEL